MALREDVDEQEGRDEGLGFVPEDGAGGRENGEEHPELGQVARNLCRKIGAHLSERGPLLGSDGDPVDARVGEEEEVGDEDEGEADPDGPPVFLEPQFFPAGMLIGFGR
jgi:hypothetical protein